jgi:AraC-like DNA-binding protein
MATSSLLIIQVFLKNLVGIFHLQRFLNFMSDSLVFNPDTWLLSLDYFSASELHFDCKDVVHRKTVPYAIVAEVLEGHYEVDYLNHLATINAGHIVYVPSNTTVEFRHFNGKSGKMRARWLHFSFLYRGMVDFLSLFETPVQLPQKTAQSARLLLDSAINLSRSPCGEIKLLATRYSLGAQMLDLLCTASRKKNEGTDSIPKQRLEPLVNFMHENLHTPLSIETLCRNLGLSRPRLHALFNSAFGCGPMQYVKKMRLELAARLLIRSEDKLDAIAFRCGFSDGFHLSHAFKTHFGISPKIFRKHATQQFP